MLSSNEDEIYDSNLVNLPAADESSVDLLAEQFVKATSTTLYDTSYINYWAHDGHQLKLITIDELNDKKDDDEILLICNGCVKPIRTDGDQFYGCIPCKYFLHKFCAGLPTKFQYRTMLFVGKCSEPYNLFQCNGCGAYCNGILFTHSLSPSISIMLHIGCMTLPTRIIHESHFHPLTSKVYRFPRACKACEKTNYYRHGCEQCDFYLCSGCIMKARTVKHRWDSHPLHLIYEPEMVTDHEHEYNCEFCSDDINTNRWFYHCNYCDLSFHLNCFEKSYYHHYSNIKFGITDIMRDKLHPHSLTLVLNKKFRGCEKCHDKQLGEPVLECAPCKTLLCRRCWEPSLESVQHNQIMESVQHKQILPAFINLNFQPSQF